MLITVRDELEEDAESVRLVDADAVATLRQTYRPNQKGLANKNRLSRDLKRLVAIAEGRLVGTLQFYLDGEGLHVIGLGVSPEFRRQGVARALLSELVERARSLRIARVMLNTVKETGNVPIFMRLGFRVTSEEPDDFSESDQFAVLTNVELCRDV